jgi:hypothetical protein
VRAAAVALAVVAAAPPGAGAPDGIVRAWPEEGVRCPVEPGVFPPWATAVGRALPDAPAPALVPRDDDDLVMLRWSGVEAFPVSEELPIVVEDGTVGLMIRADAPNDRFRVSVELLGPEGELLACADCDDAPAVGEVRPGRGTTQMPSTDRPGWELRPGRYAFRVRVEPAIEDPGADGTEVDVTATLRSDAGAEVQRFLDLNFIYLPECGLSRDIAPAAPEFREMIERVDEWLEPTGIRLGRITHNDLDRRGYSNISTWEEAAHLFRSSRQLGRPRALNVYCVRGFEPPLNPAVGLSGGIPGPSFDGTPDSGIIVRTSPLFTCSDCTDAFASLFVHEFGHYLGLYHTTEANLRHEDPFSDTPRCEKRDLRQCPDWSYVMFPVIHPANRVWSPGQIEVVRTHPLVRTVPVVRPRVASPLSTPAADAAEVAAAPNPFRDRVELRRGGVSDGPARARIYDVTGRVVRRLGTVGGTFAWDGRDDRGRVVPGGVYFARITETGVSRTVRIVKRQ